MNKKEMPTQDNNIRVSTSSRDNLELELEELAAQIDREQEEENDEFDFNDEPPPVKGARFWGILILVFIVVAVGVLYVYQVGDDKTILGNQSIPAAQPYPAPTQAALNIPTAGTMQRPVTPQAPNQAKNNVVVHCNHCGQQGIPFCAGCSAPMQLLNSGAASSLLVCPKCGAVGVPICQVCGNQMTTAANPVSSATKSPIGAAAIQEGGQYICPSCGAGSLPVWDANGVPRCPGCNGVMTKR